MKLTIGLYGLYLLLVAIKGNGETFTQNLQKDAPGFLPWLIAAAVLGALYQYEKTRAFAGLFILLAAITFITKNFTQLEQQIKPLYSSALTPATTIAAAPTTAALPALPAPATTTTSTGQQ